MNASRDRKRDFFFSLLSSRSLTCRTFFSVGFTSAMTHITGYHLGKRPENRLNIAPDLSSSLALLAGFFFRSRFSSSPFAGVAGRKLPQRYFLLNSRYHLFE